MARTEGQWQKGISLITPSENVPILLRNSYLNFGGELIGETGYGFRDNGGVMQVKDSGGSWANFGAGGGSGDVVGPASSTDNAIARFDGITGKLVQNSTVTVGDTGAIATTIANTSNVVGLTITQDDTTNNPRAVSVTNTGTANAVLIDQNGAASTSTSVGGALLVENTGNSGAGVVIYSNHATATGRLLSVRADNAGFATQPVYVENDGTSHAVSIVHNSTSSNANAITATSINENDSTLGISGRESGKGTVKITHNKPDGVADTNAAAISISLARVNAADTSAAQGIFLDSTHTTTGKLLNLRNNASDRFIVNADGSASFAGDVSVPDEAYDATAWNGSLEVPTKNAVRDKIEALSIGGGTQTINNEAAGSATLVVGELSAASAIILNVVTSNAASQTITLPAAVVGDVGKWFQIFNIGTNRMTLTSSSTLDGSVTLAAGSGCTAYITATDFYTLIGTGNLSQEIQLPCVDWATDVTTGDGKYYFRVPDKYDTWEITSVHAELITAGTTGTNDIQIANVTDAVDILSTKLTIDSTETGSDTAAAPAVINTSNNTLALNDIIRVDVDAASTTKAKGLIVSLTIEQK